MKVRILNIPNYYSSYYLKGLSQVSDLKYQENAEFKAYNGKPFLLFEAEGRFGVIDNDDPSGIQMDLYNQAECYFATNKLLNREDYNLPKVKPLFPHFPINVPGLYLKLFGMDFPKVLGLKGALKEAYTLYNRPQYKWRKPDYNFLPYVFFAGSIWKKEKWANQLRAEFISACQKHPLIEFEGGLSPRTDGDNMGLDEVLSQRKYSPKEFSALSTKSMVAFNNPAVLGAVSWRLAEYWNMSSFVLSYPFQIDLPVQPVHGQHIHFLEDGNEVGGILDDLMKNKEYHKKIALGGKSLFDQFGQPHQQAEQILNKIFKSR